MNTVVVVKNVFTMLLVMILLLHYSNFSFFSLLHVEMTLCLKLRAASLERGRSNQIQVNSTVMNKVQQELYR